MSIKIEKSPIDSERYFSRSLMEEERSVLLKKINERNNKRLEIKDRIKKIEDFIKSKNFEIDNIANEIDLINQGVLVLKNKFERSTKKEKELKDDLYSKLLNLLGKKSELSKSVYNNFDKFINEKNDKEYIIKNKTSIIQKIELEILDLKSKIKELDKELFLVEEESLDFKKDFLEFIKKRKSFFDKYKPLIDKLFQKFKDNDFNKEKLDEIKKEIENLRLKNEINEEIENYLNNYIENLKQRNVKNISKEKGVVFIHSIGNGTTGSNSSLKLMDNNNFYTGDTWKNKIDILLSINPNISTSTISEGDNEKHVFGSRFGVIVSDGFIDSASSGDGTTITTSLYGSKYKIRDDYSYNFFSQSDKDHIGVVKKIEENQINNSSFIDDIVKNKTGLASGLYNEISIQNPKFSGIFICTNNGSDRLDIKDLEKNNKIPKLKDLYEYQKEAQIYEMFNGLFYKIFIENKNNEYFISLENNPSDPYSSNFVFDFEKKQKTKNKILESEIIDPKKLGNENIVKEKDKFNNYIRGLREYKFDTIIGLYQDYIDYVFGYKLDFAIDSNNELLDLIGLSFESNNIKKYIQEEKDNNESLNSLDLKEMIMKSDKFKKFLYNKTVEFINRLVKNINNPIVSKTIYSDPFYIKGIIEKYNVSLSDLSEESKIFLENIFEEKGVNNLIKRRRGENDTFIVKSDEIELI